MRGYPTIVRLAALFILGIGEFFVPLAGRAQESQQITYQGVDIQPGDVINFLGGEFTEIPGWKRTYGHSALYLGIDPQGGRRSFLDFHASQKDERAFSGEILGELEFLTYNAKNHPSFDVFRLQDISMLDQRRLLQEAKLIAYHDNWNLFSEVCSDAVAAVLSKAAGRKIIAKTPDDFLNAPFQRHPQLTGRSISIQAALREVKALEAVDARSAQLQHLVPQMILAHRQARRTALTLEEQAALTAVRRQSLLDAEWDYLRTLVGYACSEPGDLGTLNDQGRVAGVTLEEMSLRAYVASDRPPMSGCETQIFSKILASDGATSIRSLVGWGVTYRSEHSFHVALKRLLDKMREYGAEVGRAASSTNTLPSGGEDSSSSGPSSAPSRSSTSPSDWSSLNQVRGIAASGTWPQ
jgi:hypothetical protein